VLGVAGTAQLIRIMRSNLLDELRKPYVMTARARGLSEYRVVMRYPVRVALNPFVSTIGYLLPYIVSGSIIVSLVLSLPTVGPLLLKALIAQDMFLAGTIILLLGVMTVIGTVHFRPAADVGRSPHPAGARMSAGASADTRQRWIRAPGSPPKTGLPSPRSGSSSGGASGSTSSPSAGRSSWSCSTSCRCSPISSPMWIRPSRSAALADGAAADPLDRRRQLQAVRVRA
jgi:hypothetical protein